MEKQEKYTPVKNICFLLKELWNADKLLVIYTLFKALSENIYYVFSYVWLTKYIYRCIELGTPFNEFTKVIVIICVIHIMIHISSAGHQYYLKTRTPIVYKHIYGKVIDTSLKMDYKKFEEPSFYDKFTRALNESVTRGLETLVTFSWFLATIAGALLASILVINVDPVILLFVIPSVVCSLYFGSKAGAVYYQLDYSNTRDGRIVAYIKRIFYEKKYAAELRLFHIANPLFKKHEESYEKLYQRTKKLRKKACGYEIIRWFIFCMMCYVLPFAYVAWVCKHRSGVDVAAYLAMVVTLEFVAGNIADMVEKMVMLNKGGMFISNLREFLNIRPEEKNSECHPVESSLDDIEINHLSFRYEGAAKDTLKDINLHIKKGSRIALVGYNGAGKTTLVKLLMGLYEATAGEIKISGENINQYESESFHSHFGTVFQDFQVFALPLCENVLMKKPETQEERDLVVEALNKAQFGDKLKKLPKGIDTIVTKEFDSEGIVLSGGETQKIAIARIFAQNPDIIILDEPSSALDPIAEYNMYKNMMEVAKDRTVIFISHRLSSARVADKIYLMENGRIAEEGTHDELMDKDGIYAEMFRLQASNYQDAHVEEEGDKSE